MDLESLKAALEALQAELAKDPENAELKAKVAEAQKAYDDKKAEEDAEGGDDKLDDKLDDKTKAYIAKLRKENAGHRAKNKDLTSKFKTSEEQKKAILKAAGIETEEDDPTEKIKSLTVETQTKDFRLAILESAIQNGVTGDALDYYEFLISKEAAKLEDGDELSEEAVAEVVKKAKAFGKGSANTSVGTGGGKGDPAPKPGDTGGVTLDQFIRMSIVEKSKLFETRPDLYKALVAEARAKKKLV